MLDKTSWGCQYRPLALQATAAEPKLSPARTLGGLERGTEEPKKSPDEQRRGCAPRGHQSVKLLILSRLTSCLDWLRSLESYCARISLHESISWCAVELNKQTARFTPTPTPTCTSNKEDSPGARAQGRPNNRKSERHLRVHRAALRPQQVSGARGPLGVRRWEPGCF